MGIGFMYFKEWTPLGSANLVCKGHCTHFGIQPDLSAQSMFYWLQCLQLCLGAQGWLQSNSLYRFPARGYLQPRTEYWGRALVFVGNSALQFIFLGSFASAGGMLFGGVWALGIIPWGFDIVLGFWAFLVSWGAKSVF